MGDAVMEPRAIAALTKRGISALIYMTIFTREITAPDYLYGLDIPVILLNCYTSDYAFPAVVPSEIAGGQGLAWRPVRVFDDGQHVYIQMPPTFQASEAPVLLVQTRGGESALVNYRVRLPYYVVDRLFDTAILIVGVGSQQDRVTIRRKAEGQ